MNNQILLNLEQAAAALGGISERTVRRLIKDGELKAIKIRGCAPRVRPEDVQKFVDAIANPQNQEDTQKCPTYAKILPFGGSATPTQTAKELDALLTQQTKKKPLHSKANLRQKPIK